MAKKAAINDDAIGVLASGQQPVGLSKEEMLAHDFIRQFTTAHHISSDLYQQALETFEEEGVVDMLVLAGHYLTVSAVLNTFAVPAPVSQKIGEDHDASQLCATDSCRAERHCFTSRISSGSNASC